MFARALRCAVAVLVGGALAASLAGCGGSGVGTSSGPVEPSISVQPSTPPGPADTAHAGAQAVTPQVRAQVLDVVTGRHISVADTSSVNVTYSADRQQVTVTGPGMTSADPQTDTTRTVQSVTLQQSDGGWRVLNVVSVK